MSQLQNTKRRKFQLVNKSIQKIIWKIQPEESQIETSASGQLMENDMIQSAEDISTEAEDTIEPITSRMKTQAASGIVKPNPKYVLNATNTLKKKDLV